MLFASMYVLQPRVKASVDPFFRGSLASIVRMIYLQPIAVPTGDFFVKINKLSLWSTVEPGVGITVASLATLRPLFSKLVERTRQTSIASYTSPSPTSGAIGTQRHATSRNNETRGNSDCMSSDTIVVPTLPPGTHDEAPARYKFRTSKEEKVEDIEAEMRAYGMSDTGKPMVIEDEGFDRYTPELRRARETERRLRWFQSQRATRTAPPRDCREHISMTEPPFSPVESDMSSRRQLINDSVENWQDEFVLEERPTS